MQPIRQSLTFAQDTHKRLSSVKLTDVNPGVFSVGFQSANTFGTIAQTNAFNNEFNNIFNELNDIRNNYHRQVNDLLMNGSRPEDSLRNKGVELAWKYELAELQMGGNGSTNWSPSQQQEILDHGRVRGAEGHHINNVANHPSQQANPDNIRFAKNRDEHLKMHGGDFRNETSGDMIDRNERLEKTNHDRVFNNELAGIGAAAAIGLGIGFTLGFVVTLAQTGFSAESLRNALIVGSKIGIESAALGVVNHLVVRGIGELATNALQGAVQNLGITVTDNITKMCNMGIVGILAIVVFCVYQFVKLKSSGLNTKECLLRVGRSAAFSITVLVLGIIAQGIWGGPAGIVVSISTGMIVLVYKLANVKWGKQVAEKIRIYTIDKYQPVY